ncbi:MAG TPA: acyl-CoA dehydrogenase family protein [Candidatus Binataceae bacterium]|nr:acyl-CoA dehydrogenase family protein [Candidatus Binataceae bacterium]
MSDRQNELVALAAELARDFAPRAEAHDRDGSFPVENVDRMRETGYTALVVPEKHGGLGADLLDFVLCQEQLAQGCAPTALAINMHLFGLGSMVERKRNRPNDELLLEAVGRQHVILGGGLSEPETGGDWGFFATRARRDGDGYILNGRKIFTSLAPVIDLFLVMATIEDASPPSAATFAVPRGTPGAEIIETWDALGMRATASHDLILKDVRVPAAAKAEERPIGPIDENAVSLFAWFSLSVAAIYTGVAMAALRWTREFADRFKPLILPRSIKYLPGVQFAAAEAETMLAQSRALYLSCAREYMADRAAFAGEAGLARVVIPKYAATNNAIRIVDQCMEIAGAHGIIRRNPLERYFRDVRAGVNHPMSNARARELIGKAALGIRLMEMPRW